jgi:tetrapyrrole methylase family protein / MazG family protein
LAQSEFQRLVEIISTLRGPGGCPWDREQTHDSMKPYLLEESYEVLDSIDRGDASELKEELGDLLLQIVFHARLAEEKAQFTIRDVIRGISEKLVRRHPNVFGQADIRTAEEQTRHWEKLKKAEGKSSVLDGVPRTAPALLRAYRVQQKAATVGFDWKSPEPVLDKVREELGELEQEIRADRRDLIAEEFGDFLFSMVNLARFLRLHPEECLSEAVDKFSGRFRRMEAVFRERGIPMESRSLEEMDAVWNEVKRS